MHSSPMFSGMAEEADMGMLEMNQMAARNAVATHHHILVVDDDEFNVQVIQGPQQGLRLQSTCRIPAAAVR